MWFHFIFSPLLYSSLSQLFILSLPFGPPSPPSSSILTEFTEVISLCTSYASEHISADMCLLTFFAAPPGNRQELSLSSPQNQLFSNPGLSKSLAKTFLILVVTFSHLQTCKLRHFFIPGFLEMRFSHSSKWKVCVGTSRSSECIAFFQHVRRRSH